MRLFPVSVLWSVVGEVRLPARGPGRDKGLLGIAWVEEGEDLLDALAQEAAEEGAGD
jgi:hypothetical protein